MKIRDPDLSNDPLQKEHAEVGLPQLEAGTFQGEKHPFLFLFKDDDPKEEKIPYVA